MCVSAVITSGFKKPVLLFLFGEAAFRRYSDLILHINKNETSRRETKET